MSFAFASGDELEKLLGGPNATVNQSAQQRQEGATVGGQPQGKPTKPGEEEAAPVRPAADDDTFKMRSANVLGQIAASTANLGFNPYSTLPTHMMALKDALAGKYKDNTLVEDAFGPQNLGKTVVEIHEDGVQATRRSLLQTAAMVAATSGFSQMQMSTLMEMSEQALQGVPLDKLAENVKKKLPSSPQQPTDAGAISSDEGSYGGIAKQAPIPGGGALGEGELQRFDVQDTDAHKIEGAATERPTFDPGDPATWGPHWGSGGFVDENGNVRPDPTTVDRTLRQLDRTRLDIVLSHIDALMSNEPRLKIAPLKKPPLELLIASAVVGLFNPQFASKAAAVPYQVVMAEQARQQQSNDAQFEGDVRLHGQKVQSLTQLAQEERIIAGQDLQAGLAADEAKTKASDERFDRFMAVMKYGQDERKLTAQEKQRVSVALGRISTAISQNSDKNPEAIRGIIETFNQTEQLGWTPEQIDAMVSRSGTLFGLNVGQKEANLSKTWAQAAQGWFDLGMDEKFAQMERQLGVDLKILDKQKTEKEISYMDADKALEWVKTQAEILNIRSIVEDRKFDNQMDKAEFMRNTMSDYIGSLDTQLAAHQKTTAELGAAINTTTAEIKALRTQREPMMGGISTEEDAQIAAIDKQLGDAIAKKTTMLAEAADRRRAEDRMSQNIATQGARVTALDQQMGNYNVETGEGLSIGTKQGTYKVGPWTVKFDEGGKPLKYEFGAKGKSGTTDCSGFVCSAVKSGGVTNFPEGTATQLEYIKARLRSATRPTGAWADMVPALNAGEDNLQPGDIAFINSPESPSGRHAMIFSHYDEVTGRPVWAAAWSEKTGVTTKFNDINNDNSFIGIYRYVGGK